MNIIRAIAENLYTLIKKPNITIHKIYDCYFLGRILGIKKNVILYFNKQKIIIPNKPIPFIVLEEVFVQEQYKKLRNLNHVLDIGGYLGESAVYLSQRNKKVSVFEADPINFKYIQKNINSKIEAHNVMIVANKNKNKTFSISDNFDYGGNAANLFKKNIAIKTKQKHIKEIIKNQHFDGLKMDIEGGEFEMFAFFTKNKDLFTFKKGIIEIHFFGKNKQRYQIFKDFLKFLEKNYIFTWIGLNQNSFDQKYKKLKKEEMLLFHIYFKQ